MTAGNLDSELVKSINLGDFKVVLNTSTNTYEYLLDGFPVSQDKVFDTVRVGFSRLVVSLLIQEQPSLTTLKG